MKTILYKASTRGYANHGWLDTHHTFSFADYYNPERMNFGALRVLNDDTIDAGEGFGRHPHDNMEIITIPLSGDLEHMDSMGHKSVIKSGDVQVMSAGSGLSHSEYNANKDKAASLFQIWIFPNKKNVVPRYDQRTFDLDNNKNSLIEVVSPNENSDGLWIHQNAWINLGTFDKGTKSDYQVKNENNGVFVMVIEGEFKVSGTDLRSRDALGVFETDSVSFEALSDNARLLLMEIPMKF